MEAHLCVFDSAMTVTRVTQAGNLGADGNPTDMQAQSVTEVVIYRCRHCLREIKAKDVPAGGLP